MAHQFSIDLFMNRWQYLNRECKEHGAARKRSTSPPTMTGPAPLGGRDSFELHLHRRLSGSQPEPEQGTKSALRRCSGGARNTMGCARLRRARHLMSGRQPKLDLGQLTATELSELRANAVSDDQPGGDGP